MPLHGACGACIVIGLHAEHPSSSLFITHGWLILPLQVPAPAIGPLNVSHVPTRNLHMAVDSHNHFPISAVADLNPNSTFLGIDLSPIQPHEVPPNCHFMVDDIEHENGWDLDRDHFDFIHLRHTLHSVRNRPELMQRAYEYARPSHLLGCLIPWLLGSDLSKRLTDS